MEQRTPVRVALSIAGVFALLPSSAFAAVSFGVLPQGIFNAAANSLGRCEIALAPAVGQAQLLPSPAPLDKASAILGGRASRLDQVTRQQSGQSASPASAAGTAGLAQPSMASAPGRPACSRLMLPSATTPAIDLAIRGRSPAPEDFLASQRLRIQRTSFDAAWTRVQRQKLPRGIVSGFSRIIEGQANLATLAAVNSWANARIRYVEDKVLYGKADYWAGARATLQRGAGDCEDIAIAKLQLLAALGVPRSDMFLTVARDLARNADHAMLIVRLDGRNWLLDNATNEVLDASMSYDYRPIMSFSTSGKWLHGYSQL